MAVVHLVDASPYIFRAYFALPESMTGPDGQPTNAVYGFADFLSRLLRTEEPTHFGVAFDESLTTSFRNEIYAAYKAQRELPPPALEAQLRACREVTAALGAAVFVSERYEADDLIATLCHQLRRKRHGAVVVTSDKDLAQLVSEKVTLFDFAREKRYGPAEVEAKFGVRPDQIADFLALAGDTVDNIPGVKGVGAKSAAALLQAFGHLEDLYDRLDEVADLPVRGAASLMRKLAAQREQALLSLKLSVAARDAPATADLQQLRYRGADARCVDPLFRRLGLLGIRDRVPRWKS
ncbi:MAG: 5'-3' exonuclease [Planctomycetota bacterium]|jgi:5'-3' exonuclease